MPLTISFPLNPTEGQVYIFTGEGFSAIYTFKNGIWTTGTGITGMLASDLIGTTLAPNVVISSLTSVGTLTALRVTDPIVGNITGNAATATMLQSILPILRGGTGQSTANRALNALLPTQTFSAGKFLRTDASNAYWSSIPSFSDESLTGEVTTVGLIATINNNAVIDKVLTGYVSGAGTIAATDTILQAIQKLNGNTETGGAAAAGTLTGTTLAGNVVNSELQSVGVLEFLSVVNPIIGSITGNAATATIAISASNALTANAATTATIATSAITAGTVTTAAQPAITSVGTLTAVNTSGVITGTNTTASTSSTTGAVITAGGLGVAGAAFIGDGATVFGASGLTIKDDITDTRFLHIHNEGKAATYIVKRGSANRTLNILHESFGQINIGDSDGANNNAYIGVYDNNNLITINAQTVEIPQGAISAPYSKAILATTETGQGFIPSVQIIIPSADFTLVNDMSVQDIFASSQNLVTLQANTTYMFESMILEQNSAATATSHYTALSLTLDGGATASSSIVSSMGFNTSGFGGATLAQTTTCIEDIANNGWVATSTTTSSFRCIKFEGTIRVTDGGTMTPQLVFSAAPGNTTKIKVGSYFKIYAIGSDTVQTIG